MKTIEERAEAYVNRHNSLHFTRFLAYLRGATEQKGIDIEKACEWMRTELKKMEERHYIHVHGFDDERREQFLERFVKEMEGE